MDQAARSAEVAGDASGGLLPRLWRRYRHGLPVALGLLVFVAGLEVLRAELRAARFDELVHDVLSTPWLRMAAAVALTALNYLVLTGYDLLAFRYIRKALPTGRVMIAAFLAYAISHNVGFAALSGASVRYRFYSRWGVTTEELSRLVFSYSVTFWIGLLALAGLSLVASPVSELSSMAPAWSFRVAGWLLLFVVGGYLTASALRRAPLRMWRLSLPLPTPTIALWQLGLSALDWVLAAGVLYVLLPGNPPPFTPYLGAFLVAVLIGMASHVPGGLGVFEGLMVLLLKPWIAAEQLIPAFVVYRAVYYLLPFSIGLAGLLADEAVQRRHQVQAATQSVDRLARHITPHALSLVTFLAGIVLLASGATPAAPGRLDLLGRLVPVGVIEASHFTGSIVGAALLVLSHGVARRLDAAYYLASLSILVGMVASFLKGFDVEEALLLLLVLLALYRARPVFTRRAAFFDARFSWPWVASLMGAIGASVWLGLFAFKHVDYSGDLWWQFELDAQASRFLRASVGAAVLVLLAGVARLVGHPQREVDPPDDAALSLAAGIVERQDSTSANLVFLRDKGLLFDSGHSGFVMYGIQGHTWVAAGDPIGPPALHRDLVRAFLERVDDYGGTAAFYEIGHSGLHTYADFGMSFVKLGEEAVIDLKAFSIEGGVGAKFRQAVRRLDREGGAFRVLPAVAVGACLSELRRVSDDWLSHKAAAEKGFSLGYFDDAYVGRFPVGVVERQGRVQAFATIWPTGQKHELSIDLMRFSREAPKGVMEALLVHLMLWGRAEGYQTFSLGMAPLSGFERSAAGSMWQRFGAFVYEHGETVYGFQGLRSFKEKFNPAWHPRYLAYQGALRLPRVLADVTALVAGGYRRIFSKS